MTKMPTRLIDADRLKSSLELSIRSWSGDCNSNAPAMVCAYQDVLYRVENEPTAEVYGQWISMEERPPAVSDEYIVMIAGAKKSTCLYYDTDEGVWFDESGSGEHIFCVTKWMPLPPAEEVEADA